MARVSDAHLEARRQSILSAATKVFTQKGIAAATMAEIASEAGISPGAIYRYFENKDDLARGCMNESAEAIKNAWENPAASELPFSELARWTFSDLNKPEEAIDTQLFIERALLAVRDNDEKALAEHASDHEAVRQGILFLMQAEFRSALDGIDAKALAEALYSFYWGSRLLKMLVPEVNPEAQFLAVQAMMDRAFKRAAVPE